MTAILQFKRGDILVLTTGEYSDFGLSGFLVAIQDMDLPALAQQFRADEIAESGAFGTHPEKFPAWLVAKGHALPVDAQTVHLGDWGWPPEFGIE